MFILSTIIPSGTRLGRSTICIPRYLGYKVTMSVASIDPSDVRDLGIKGSTLSLYPSTAKYTDLLGVLDSLSTPTASLISGITVLTAAVTTCALVSHLGALVESG